MRRFPLLFPAAGIGFGLLIGEGISALTGFILVIFFLFLAFVSTRSRLFWFYLLIGCFFLGSLLLQRETARQKGQTLAILHPGPVILEGVVIEEPWCLKKGRLLKTKFLFEIRQKEGREKIYVTLINSKGEIRRGDRLELKGELKSFIPRQNPRFKPRFQFLGFSYGSYALQGQDIFQISLLSPLRRYLAKRFEDLLPDPEAQILKGMILGMRSSIEKEWNEIFSRLGVIHILSVSGFHMSVAGAFFYFLGRLTLRGPRFSIASALLGLIFYYYLSGEAVPSFRSVVMAFAFFGGRLSGREGNLLNSLALAFLVSLLIRPADLFGLSFQLSYLVVLGLVLYFTFLRKSLKKPSRDFSVKVRTVLKDSWSVSLICFLFAEGLVSYYFGILSPVTILVNLFFSPLFTLILLLGFLLMAVAPLGDLIGGLFSLLVYVPTHFFLEVSRRLAGLPFFAFREIHFSESGVILYYVLLAIGMFLAVTRKRRRIWMFQKRLLTIYRKGFSRNA